jgi:molybdate transport system regulatory protein
MTDDHNNGGEGKEAADPWVLVKVVLMAPGEGKTFCGPGMINLLWEIEKTGSVRQACERMHMSYSKGWKLLRGLENWLRYPVTVRQQGGKGGGEAHLTAEGRDFLRRHQAFDKECQQAVQRVFERYYGGTAE